MKHPKTDRPVKIIYWLRNDLRIQENPCLHWILGLASQSPAPVEVLSLFPEPVRWAWAGAHRQRFLAETLAELDCKTPLRRLDRPAFEAIAGLVPGPFTHLVYTKSSAVLERDEEARVAELCRTKGLTVIALETHCLFAEDQLPFQLQKLPRVFTPFRKAIEEAELEASLKSLPPVAPSDLAKVHWLATDLELGSRPMRSQTDSSAPEEAPSFRGGEDQALRRLQHFIWQTQALATYKDTRNGLMNFDDSSKFSPWLANGSLSVRTIASEVHRYEEACGPNESTRWFILELLWREFFKLCARRDGARLFRRDGLQRKGHFRVEGGKREFQAWCQGSTGQDFVDANMRELNATGWMSNRGRQNVASYLAKTLRVDWRLGAEYFEQQLIDYDPESNWGNWAYLAGVGADPRDRVFNCTKQAQDYDPTGAYREKWRP